VWRTGQGRFSFFCRLLPPFPSPKELRELFGTFGAVKSLRLPKKMDGSHRGFCFVEYASGHEAREAVQRLGATHLYGRRLVLEWVDSGGDGVGGAGSGVGGLAAARVSAARDATRATGAANLLRQKRKIMGVDDPEGFGQTRSLGDENE
jgi:RNA recognition motif-containing protein